MEKIEREVVSPNRGGATKDKWETRRKKEKVKHS